MAAVVWINDVQPRSEPAVLRKGDALPFFDVATLDGVGIRYADVWQRKNIVLVTLPAASTSSGAAYAKALSARSAEFHAHHALCIVTRDVVPGIPSPAVTVADRWGEVQYLASSAAVQDLPDASELLDVLDYVQRRCPECEGEWR